MSYLELYTWDNHVAQRSRISALGEDRDEVRSEGLNTQHLLGHRKESGFYPSFKERHDRA